VAIKPLNPLTIPEGVGSDFAVEVRSEMPFLPKVAFVVISLASLAGAIFTGRSLGVSTPMLGFRWFALWVGALALGFVAWRVFYLRSRESGLNTARVQDHLNTSLTKARPIARGLAIALALSTPIPFLLEYPSTPGALLIASATAVTAVLFWTGLERYGIATGAFSTALLASTAWGIASTGLGLYGIIRVTHLVAFGLWIGGALWNLAVAIPAGTAHPVIDAVVGAARHLQRFRWVVRFALPTVIITGLIQADAYRELDAAWWVAFPGVLIPLKLVLIVALVVIFITCPLYRQCSPVTGVCRIDDIDRG